MTQLVTSDAVAEIVAARDAALSRYLTALARLAQARELLDDAHNIAQRAHGGTPFYEAEDDRKVLDAALSFRVDPEQVGDAIRRRLDGQVWMHVLERTGMRRVMDAASLDEFRAQLREHVPEVTEQAIWDSVAGAREDAQLYFRRGLARAFSGLDPRFKSHDAFCFRHRVVLTHMFDEWGFWNVLHRKLEVLRDIERCFAVLSGQEPDFEEFRRSISEAREGSGPRQGDIDTRFFRVRTFMNGNLHLWFRDRDLLDRVNLELAAYYGEVLPDGVPADADERDLRSRSGALSKDLAFYPTPELVVKELLRWLPHHQPQTILEPSAGTGNIAEALLARGHRVHAIEVDGGRAAQLAALARVYPKATTQRANFLLVDARPVYDAVVMNPPFAGTHWMEHVRHAFDFLRPGGELVSVLPATAQVRETKKHRAFQSWAKKSDARWTDLPQESFAASGTRIATVVLRLRRSW